MYLSNEGMLIILLVGLIAGWLAGKIVRGAGTGLIGNIAIGIVGAFIASWLLPRLGISLGSGFIRAVIDATIGAVMLLAIIRIARGSLNETRHWLRRAYTRKLLTQDQIDHLKPLIEKLAPTLNAFLRSIGKGCGMPASDGRGTKD